MPPASASERVHGNRAPVVDVVAPPALAAGGDVGNTEGVAVGEDVAAGENASRGDNPWVDVARVFPAFTSTSVHGGVDDAFRNVIGPRGGPAAGESPAVGAARHVLPATQVVDEHAKVVHRAPRASAKKAMDDPFWSAPVPSVLTPPSHAVATPLPPTVKTTVASLFTIAGGAEKKAPSRLSSKLRTNRSTVSKVMRGNTPTGTTGKPGRKKNPGPMPAPMTPKNPGSNRKDVTQRKKRSVVVSPANGKLSSKVSSEKTPKVRKGTPGRKKNPSPKSAGVTTRQPALNRKRSQSKKTASVAVSVTMDAASSKVSSQKTPPARKTKGNPLSQASSGKTTQTRRKKPCTSLQNVKDLINNDVFTWARETHTFGNKIKNQFTDAEFISWDEWFRKQIVQKFQRMSISAKDRTESLGRGLRSVAKEDLLVDEEARLVHVTDARRLSHCHFEDILRMQEGARVVLYFKTNINSTNLCSELLSKPFHGKPWHAAEDQRQAGIAGNVSSIVGTKFLVLRATIFRARYHHDAVAGFISLAEMKDLFLKKQGFTVKFDGTKIIQTLTWQEVIQYAEEILIFGPPLDGTRRYNTCFRDRGAEYCKRVYRHLGNETLGDVQSSSALALAYQEKVIQIQQNEIHRLQNKTELAGFNETVHGERFFRVFDNMCRRRMLQAVCGFNDYNKPIVDLTTIDDYVETAARVFPKLWEHLCSLRGVVQYNKSKDTNLKNKTRRKRHVLLQLHLLKRTKKNNSLKWWSLIQGIGYTAWGVGGSALNAIKTFGITCSSQTRNRAVSVLCDKLVARQTLLFSRELAIIFVIDNYGQTVKLLHQRGDHSATRLSGTNEMAVKVNPYSDTQYDHIKCDVEFVVDQNYPSPALMADYEKDAERGISDATFYHQHSTRGPAPNGPCSDGSRVRAYIDRRDDSIWIYEMGIAFGDERATPIDELPPLINRNNVREFREIRNEEEVQFVISQAGKMQLRSRQIWNPFGDCVTLTNYMGLVAMDEDTTNQNGSLGLDIAAKCGLLVKTNDGKWEIEAYPNARRVYFVGDAKTADLFEKCLYNLVNNPGFSAD